MYEDLVRFPDLDERIFLCLARRNRGEKLLVLFDRYRSSGECLFEATEASFFGDSLIIQQYFLLFHQNLDNNHQA